MGKYLGDFEEDATIDFKFNTVDQTFAPVAMAGSPALAVYKANGTTESTAGLTLTEGFDSRTGLHHVRIDTSADAFYAAGQDYQVAFTSGTADGVSLVGRVVGQFSIEKRVSKIFDVEATLLDEQPWVTATLTGTPTTTELRFSSSGFNVSQSFVGWGVFIVSGTRKIGHTTVTASSESGGTFILTVSTISGGAPANGDRVILVVPGLIKVGVAAGELNISAGALAEAVTVASMAGAALDDIANTLITKVGALVKTATGTPTTTETRFASTGLSTGINFAGWRIRAVNAVGGAPTGEEKLITSSSHSGGNYILTHSAFSTALASGDSIKLSPPASLINTMIQAGAIDAAALAADAATEIADAVMSQVTEGSVEGTVEASPSPAVGSFDVNVGIDRATGVLNNAFLMITSGSGSPQSRLITTATRISATVQRFAFSGSAGDLDEPFAVAPSAGDTVRVLGRGR